jgi:hypothetical protein
LAMPPVRPGRGANNATPNSMNLTSYGATTT